MVRGIFSLDVAGVMGYGGSWDVRLEGWAELDHGRPGCYPFVSVGLGVTCPYLHLRKIILGHQGGELGQLRLGAGSPGRRLVQESRGAAVQAWRRAAL